MTETVKLQRVRGVVDTLEYPISNEAAQAATDDIVVLYADGREPLADVIGRSRQDRFETAEDVEAEVLANAPVEAVGEPGQSEGEG